MQWWLTRLVEALVMWRVRQLPLARREWGEGIVAEFCEVPDGGGRRLRWALGGLWVVLRGGRAAGPPVPERRGRVWLSRLFVLLGVVSVAPWLIASAQGLGDDAPDGTYRSMLTMLIAEVALAVAFLANLWRRNARAAGLGLMVTIFGYAGAAAFAAADNGQHPVLTLVAPVLFAGPPLMLAVPLVVLAWSSRTASPTP